MHYQRSDEFRGFRRAFRWLHNGAIARGNGTNQRAEGNLQGVIPGTNDQRNAEWFATNVATVGGEKQASFHLQERIITNYKISRLPCEPDPYMTISQ